MAWIEISISVAREGTAPAERVLEQLGALAITLQDDADNPVLEPGPGLTPLWPTVQVLGLFETGVERERVMEALQTVPGADRPDRIRWREVGDQDWERAWMERFAPMKFGDHLWIVPGGMQIPFDPDNVEIRLDPGLAFGTGTHPTTALCLEWLDGQDIKTRSLVDYGCGSGILGIAAALKGAARVICVDNDPQALEATRENARRNGVSHLIECLFPEEYSAPGVDIVLANILASPLIALAPLLLRSLRPGGSLVLSGLLEDQAEQVLAAYRQNLTDVILKTLEGWVRLQGMRNSENQTGSYQLSGLLGSAL
jgi:ribosomal protein L11 methyltransferase